MFVFGHVGLTWGGTAFLAELSRRLSPPDTRPTGRPDGAARVPQRQPGADVDYRFVILGSMLPDLIDKPLGVFIFSGELGSGRIFAHGLGFVLLLLLAALALPRSAGAALSLVALGAAVHLVLDRMWMDADTLFWPLSGWRPERQDVGGWLDQMLEQLFSDPYTYISEAAGVLVVTALLASLLMAGGFRVFIRSGRMPRPLIMPTEPGLAAGEDRPQQLERGQRPAD